MPPVSKTFKHKCLAEGRFRSDILMDIESKNWQDMANFLRDYTKLREEVAEEGGTDHAYRLGYDDGLKGRNPMLAKRSDGWNEIYMQGYEDGQGDCEFGQS